MFITKKHLSRRTFLRGAGVVVGLPLLDAMVPAWTQLVHTAAAPKSHRNNSLRARRFRARRLADERVGKSTTTPRRFTGQRGEFCAAAPEIGGGEFFSFSPT